MFEAEGVEDGGGACETGDEVCAVVSVCANALDIERILEPGERGFACDERGVQVVYVVGEMRRSGQGAQEELNFAFGEYDGRAVE